MYEMSTDWTAYPQAGVADHRDIVDIVADGTDVGRIDIPEVRQVQDGRPLAGIVAKNFAHRAQIAWTALDERLDTAVQAIEDQSLECQHLVP